MAIGTDPEVMLVNKQGKLIASQDIIPGDKWVPFATPNGAVHRDNVLVEFGVTPANSAEEFIRNIEAVMADVKQMLPPDLDFAILSSAEYDRDQLNTLEALTFGCEGDFDAWTNQHAPTLETDLENPIRGAGGHIHMSFEHTTDEEKAQAARMADLCIGLRGVFYDKDSRRRTMYGQASRYRPKPYGCEYRTPSNYWLKSRHLMSQMYAWAEESIDRRAEAASVDAQDIPRIQEAINTGNEELAVALMVKYNIAA